MNLRRVNIVTQITAIIVKEIIVVVVVIIIPLSQGGGW